MTDNQRNISFEAEVLEVKIKKTVSTDKEIVIKLSTNQEQALRLQEYIAKDTIKIEVKE